MGGSFSIAAYAVIRDGDEGVLLCRRREGGEWVLPGGTVETGEAPWESLAREVREETGLELPRLELVGVYAKRPESDLVLVFAAEATGGPPAPSDERDEICSFPLGGLPEQLAARHRERLLDAVERGPVVLRVQESDEPEPPDGVR